MSKKIIWIASYPKSGNTYVRCLLANYLYNNDADFSFNLLSKIPKFEKTDVFKSVLNEDILDESFSYYKNYLDVQKKLIQKLNQKKLIFKTHHFFGELDNHIFTNKETTLLFIYLVRDPREVLISYANHVNESIDTLLKTFISDKIITKTKMEIIVNWGLHYRSWKSFKSVPSIFIKFEDLVRDPKEIFYNLIRFLSKYIDITIDKNQINKTIKLITFENLKKLENKYGFKEASKNNIFFKSGKIDSWKKILNNNQIKIIENKFYKEMRELGYINTNK